MSDTKKFTYKVYCIADSDYIVAKNMRDAVRCWERTTYGLRREALEDIREVPQKVWSKYRFFYDEYGKRTTSFPKRIKEVLESGEESIPFFLASSEF